MRAVLLVPSEAWRERLLGDGACGARVPQVGPDVVRDLPWVPAAEVAAETMCDGVAWLNDAALVLAWDGAIVREGRDRAAYCLAEREDLLVASGQSVGWHRSGGGYELPCGPAHGRASYSHQSGWSAWHVLPELIRSRGMPDAIRDAHALALCCAARGLGTVVVLP